MLKTYACIHRKRSRDASVMRYIPGTAVAGKIMKGNMRRAKKKKKVTAFIYLSSNLKP